MVVKGLLSIVLLGSGMFFVSAPDKPKGPAAQPKAGSAANSGSSREPLSAELRVLEQFAGPWNVKETHLNSKGDVVGSAKGIEEGAWVLDRKVLQRTYITGEEGSLFRAIALVSWNAEQKKYEGAWFDNVRTTGPTSISGAWDESSRTMTYTLISTSADGKPLQHKVVDKFNDNEHRTATTFKVDGSLVEKVLEVQFSRATPCPPNIGIVPESSGKKSSP